MSEEKVRYMNGNVYKVLGIEKEKVPVFVKSSDETGGEGQQQPVEKTGTSDFLVLDDLAGETVRPNDKAFRKLTKPRHAWALTIHKFQVMIPIKKDKVKLLDTEILECRIIFDKLN